jgi:hypothetical protein
VIRLNLLSKTKRLHPPEPQKYGDKKETKYSLIPSPFKSVV